MTSCAAALPEDWQIAEVATTYTTNSRRGWWELEDSVSSIPAGVAGSTPAVSTQTGRWEETAGPAADGKAHLASVRGAWKSISMHMDRENRRTQRAEQMDIFKKILAKLFLKIYIAMGLNQRSFYGLKPSSKIVLSCREQRAEFNSF